MIDYELSERPTGVTVIEGFPSFGLVSTIALEFLLEHLETEMIGEFVYDEFSPSVAIHEGELVKPMSIWHDEAHDLVILHTTLNIDGNEWDVAETILDLADDLEAEEIITVEGLSSTEEETQAYTFDNKALAEAGAEELDESILMGITAALLLRSDDISPLFAGAHSNLPDGEAATEIVRILKSYLDLDVDLEPLQEKTKEFEQKLEDLKQQTKQTEEEAKKRRLNYFG